MDAYTLHLLGMAVDAFGGSLLIEKYGPHNGVNEKWCLAVPGTPDYWEPTLADALAALLTDLGVEVPERPSAERVAELESWASSAGWRVLREHYAPDREPLTVLALLEGEA